MSRTCERCGVQFEVTAGALAARPSRWCSRDCADVGRRRGEGKTCVRCGKSFYLYPSHVTQPGRTGAYCSRECYGPTIGERVRGVPKSAGQRAKQAAAMRGRVYPERRKPPVVVTCLTCGAEAEYTGRRRHFAKVRKFCTTDCWYAYLRAHPEAHNWFKGGYEPYYGPNWRHQAKLARERDGHCCRICGQHQVVPRLDVHHLAPRRSFGRDDFEAMNALENLVTVCKSCHTRLELGIVSV